MLGLDPQSVVALSTVVIAVATAVLTFLTAGTWKLYKLERGRRDSAAARLAARVVREEEEIRAASGHVGGGTPGNARQFKQALEAFPSRREWLALKTAAVKELVESEVDLGPRVFAHLNVASTQLWWATQLLEQWADATMAGGRPQYDHAREACKEALLAAAGALDSAYGAIPHERRVWGGESKEFRELLDEAAAENLKRFPQRKSLPDPEQKPTTGADH